MKTKHYLILLLFCAIAPSGHAEFYIWYDDNGTKHISNVPPHCITESKTISVSCQVTLPTPVVKSQSSAWDNSQFRPVEEDAKEAAKKRACFLADSTWREAMAKYDSFPSYKKTPEAQFLLLGLAIDAEEKCEGLD